MNNLLQDDTICALATGGSLSAIAIIRLSGNNAIQITNSVFSKDIINVKAHTIRFGTITENNNIIDEVVICIFKDSNSYTGEETVEISCHGSTFIQEKLLQLFITIIYYYYLFYKCNLHPYYIIYYYRFSVISEII